MSFGIKGVSADSTHLATQQTADFNKPARSTFSANSSTLASYNKAEQNAKDNCLVSMCKGLKACIACLCASCVACLGAIVCCCFRKEIGESIDKSIEEMVKRTEEVKSLIENVKLDLKGAEKDKKLNEIIAKSTEYNYFLPLDDINYVFGEYSSKETQEASKELFIKLGKKQNRALYLL
jgi:hypothetical protein